MNTSKTNSLAEALTECASKVDQRNLAKVRHSFETILILMTLGFLMGITSYRGVYHFFKPVGIFTDTKKASGGDGGSKDKNKGSKMNDKDKKAWQKDRANAIEEASNDSTKILEQLQEAFPNIKGIPHYSTFSRAFDVADARELVISLYLFFVKMLPDAAQRHIAIDGKALRGAMNKALENHSLYIVNVFDTAARIFLVSFVVQDKKNELSTIMNELDNVLAGCPSIVTMDAAGTQKELIERMHNLGSKYVLPVKSNQKNLKALLKTFCEEQAKNASEEVDCYVDFSGHGPDESPSKVIKPVVIRIKEELNGKAGKYTQVDEEPQFQSDSNGTATEGSKEQEKCSVEQAKEDTKSSEGKETQNKTAGDDTPESKSETEESQDEQIAQSSESEQKACDMEQAKEDTKSSEGKGTQNKPAEDDTPESESEVKENQDKQTVQPSENEQEGKNESEDGDVPDIVVPVNSIHFENLYHLYPCMTTQFPFIPKGDLELDPENNTLVAVEIDGQCILMGRNADRYERTEVSVWHTPSILGNSIFTDRFDSVQSVCLVTRYRLEQHFCKEFGKHWELIINSTSYISNELFSAERTFELVKAHWAVEDRHKILDTILMEDDCTVKGHNGPWILSTLREAALNLISYFGGKWAASSDDEMNHTQGMYEFRNYVKNRLGAAIYRLKMGLDVAEDFVY